MWLPAHRGTPRGSIGQGSGASEGARGGCRAIDLRKLIAKLAACGIHFSGSHTVHAWLDGARPAYWFWRDGEGRSQPDGTNQRRSTQHDPRRMDDQLAILNASAQHLGVIGWTAPPHHHQHAAIAGTRPSGQILPRRSLLFGVRGLGRGCRYRLRFLCSRRLDASRIEPNHSTA